MAKFGLDNALWIGDEVEDGELPIDMPSGAEWLTKDDAERIIAHLQKVFELPYSPKTEQGLRLMVARAEYLEHWIKIAGGIHCPHCGDQGFTVYPSMPDGEPAQEQCQFCYECSDSVFNRKVAQPEYDNDVFGPDRT